MSIMDILIALVPALGLGFQVICMQLIGGKYTNKVMGMAIVTLLVGIGVSCEVNADVVPLAGEGFSLAVCRAFSFPFPPVKIGFDCSLVAISCLLGLLGKGTLLGVREGTIAAAILVGLVSKQVTKWVVGPLMKRICPAFTKNA